MRVLYLTNNRNRMSTTVPTEGWFRLLRPIGLDPVLVSDRRGDFHAWAAASGIPAYEVPLPLPSKPRPWSFFASLYRLWRIVRRHRVQLIHCNEQEIYPIGGYLARLCRLPVVVSVHFTMDRPFCAWAFGKGRGPRRMFFVSRSNLRNCRPALEGILPEDIFRPLYNGLDLEKFKPDPERGREFRRQIGLGDAPAIGVACALRPRKQLEHLFAATARLQSPPAKVVVAGAPVAGDELYADALLRDARALLGDRLIYLGQLTELRGLYNALDLFVNTSQEEACSISVLEALSCGCPVIGYPSKSVDEQVLPDGGEIVAQDQVEPLADALSRWLTQPDRLAEGRARARARAEAHFDIKSLALELWQEYAAVLS